MENYHQYHRHEDRCCRERRTGGSFWGIVLLVIGLLWILKETGWHVGLPGWDAVSHAAGSFLNIFHVAAFAITWPVILLIVGVLLLIGRRLVGTVLVLLALFLFLPHLFIIPGILAVIFFPVLLIVLGIIIISRLL
ncbi:MAG TPA: hypothetical protein VKA27_17685 [Sunxiuqinia sp.]|nr:hypothetical protein [Sunxiuqinia sp.]